jgi:ribosome assembly protein YihI (activator of Der GTPase)
MAKTRAKKVVAEKPLVPVKVEEVKVPVEKSVVIRSVAKETIEEKVVDKNAFLNELFDALEDGKKIGIEGSKEYFKKSGDKVYKYSKSGDYLGVFTFGDLENVEGLFIKK